MRTLFLIAFLSLSGAALSAPTTALVLPIDGPGLLPNVRNDLESAMRARLAAEPDGKKPRFALTSPDDVAAVLQDAGGAGLACSLDDAPCLVRIGVTHHFALNCEGRSGHGAIRTDRTNLGRQGEVAQPHSPHHVVDDAGVAGGEAVGDVGHGSQADGRHDGPMGVKLL